MLFNKNKSRYQGNLDIQIKGSEYNLEIERIWFVEDLQV